MLKCLYGEIYQITKSKIKPRNWRPYWVYAAHFHHLDSLDKTEMHSCEKNMNISMCRLMNELVKKYLGATYNADKIVQYNKTLSIEKKRKRNDDIAALWLQTCHIIWFGGASCRFSAEPLKK